MKCVTSSWPSGREKNREAIYDNMRGESPKKAVESPALKPATAIRQSRLRTKRGNLPVCPGNNLEAENNVVNRLRHVRDAITNSRPNDVR